MVVTPDAATVAIVALVGAACVLWAIPDGRGCSRCPHCIAREEASERAQRELRHDVDHKGMGFADGAPDRFPCLDEHCPRNPRRARLG